MMRKARIGDVLVFALALLLVLAVLHRADTVSDAQHIPHSHHLGVRV